uniref:Uncharacterized protein n=1 Tax=Oryza sativa subsp. japonica TaxID=39947 RepID=Q5Z652_ORYSJ|nr:hypothetical protein [Oryza sativa Japonica Group]BAD54539.1 hypothetical protein [Oryza sativa Japonica Group]
MACEARFIKKARGFVVVVNELQGEMASDQVSTHSDTQYMKAGARDNMIWLPLRTDESGTQTQWKCGSQPSSTPWTLGNPVLSKMDSAAACPELASVESALDKRKVLDDPKTVLVSDSQWWCSRAAKEQLSQSIRLNEYDTITAFQHNWVDLSTCISMTIQEDSQILDCWLQDSMAQDMVVDLKADHLTGKWEHGVTVPSKRKSSQGNPQQMEGTNYQECLVHMLIAFYKDEGTKDSQMIGPKQLLRKAAAERSSPKQGLTRLLRSDPAFRPQN